MGPDLSRYRQALADVDPVRLNGRVRKIVGLIIECTGPEAELGEVCRVYQPRSEDWIRAEVVGFRDDRLLLMPLGEVQGIGPGCEVVATGHSLRVPVGSQLLGRVVNGLGEPIDGRPLQTGQQTAVEDSPPHPLQRERITDAMPVGIRSIDGLLTCGRGQRMGIFAGSGVGKSVLLGMMARNTEADINVIALIGERGREVREFIEEELGEEGLARSAVVVATSDQPALVRIRGAMTATAIAEYYRDQGADVLLMMDSITRFAMAQREIGLAVGEPPTTKGYTPSVFALLPKLLERAGTSSGGSITGLYTVLVEGDDLEEPIADAVRSILDGHIVLSRDLAARGHYPAVDVLESVSRLADQITAPEHIRAARRMRHMLAVYREAEDLINIGAYEQGSNPEIDRAIHLRDAIQEFLVQERGESSSFSTTVQSLTGLFSG